MKNPELPDLSISILCHSLSDGSEVFNVYFGDVRLDALSEKDADEMAFAIREAIERHTNNTVGIKHTFTAELA